jgi:hypothetical protein
LQVLEVFDAFLELGGLELRTRVAPGFSSSCRMSVTVGRPKVSSVISSDPGA